MPTNSDSTTSPWFVAAGSLVLLLACCFDMAPREGTKPLVTGILSLSVVLGLLATAVWSATGSDKQAPKYDDGSDFMNSPRFQSEEAKKKFLRRQRVEEKRQQEAMRQRTMRQQQQRQQPRRQQQQQQEQCNCPSCIEERLRRKFEEQMRQQQRQQEQQQRQQDQQQHRQQHQQQNQQHGQQDQQQQNEQQQDKHNFAGMMGFGPQTTPAGCQGAVREVLLARNYYEVLRLNRNQVTDASLKAARRARALAVHPDKVGPDCPGANEAGGRVNLAFDTLSGPVSRREYDAWLAMQR